MGISVIIPSFNPKRAHLETLYRSLCGQSHADFEAIIVDDASDGALYALIDDPRFRVLYQKTNRGPAACRNAGAAAARYSLLFFTDTDCELAPDTLRCAVNGLEYDDAIAGNTITRTHTRFGKAVALLGFPGGGSIGFDKVWRVDAAGYTRSFSSCNLAFRKSAFEALGRFNETFPVAGGEDTVLARAMIESGRRIRYAPEQAVFHVEKSSLRDFLRWQIIRGRGNYYIRQSVPGVGGYLRLRVWTFSNSLRCAGLMYALPVLGLIALSVLFQVIGYKREKRAARADR